MTIIRTSTFCSLCNVRGVKTQITKFPREFMHAVPLLVFFVSLPLRHLIILMHGKSFIIARRRNEDTIKGEKMLISPRKNIREGLKETFPIKKLCLWGWRRFTWDSFSDWYEELCESYLISLWFDKFVSVQHSWDSVSRELIAKWNITLRSSWMIREII